MKKRIIVRNNYALAGVIEALLIIALVVMIISTIQLVYVPQIMKDKESDHMDEVLNQFSNLKSIIEVQSMLGDTQGHKAITYSPISSPITLGSEQLPYFVTTGALGQINIFDKDDVESKINVSAEIDDDDFPDDGIPLTSIRYIGDNAYFDDQTYILEGGGIILKQADGEVMKVAPPIIVQNYNNSIQINYTIPLFTCRPGKNIAGGDDITFIRTNFTRSYEFNFTDVSNLSIYTDYGDAWYESLNDDDLGLLWEYTNRNLIKVIYNPAFPNKIEIAGDEKKLDVKLIIVELGAQIGPGFSL